MLSIRENNTSQSKHGAKKNTNSAKSWIERQPPFRTKIREFDL